MEELKKNPSKMTVFDALKIPGQLDILQEDLKLRNNNKRVNEGNIIFAISDDVPPAPIGIRRPPPFYLSLRLEGWVVNNCMINTRATITIIPKAVANEMKLYITRCIDGVIQLDSSSIDIAGSVKGVPITLNAFLDICVIQDIIMVDLSPLFEICLSREFIAKLGGYLALEYTHLLLPFQNKQVKILNEGTKSVHLKKIIEQNYLNGTQLVEVFERDTLRESLLTIEVFLANDLNYQVIYASMGNYYLYEDAQPILIIAEKEYEIWTMYFDGSRCKHGCGARVVFKSLEGYMKIFSFRFIWICTSNANDNETLCLGLSKAISIRIKCLIFHGDLELVIKQVSDQISAKYY